MYMTLLCTQKQPKSSKNTINSLSKHCARASFNFHPAQSSGTESKDCLLKVGDFSGASRSFFGACRILMRTFLCAPASRVREIHNVRRFKLDLGYLSTSSRYKALVEWEPLLSGIYNSEYIRICRCKSEYIRIYR